MINLGTGTLTWSRGERVSDRYGSVYLMEDGRNSFSREPSRSLVKAQEADRIIGRRGKLLVVVKQTRESTHIGDLFHGLSPSTPKVGAKIVLGSGLFFSEPAPDGGIQVGVSPGPDDKPHKNGWWLNARNLYKAHEQTVELFFEEAA